MAFKRYTADHVDPSALGEPLHFHFSSRTAQNRFMKAAMSEQLASWDPKKLEARGIPTKSLINVYKRWGEGGFGVILSGNILFEYEHIEAAGNPIVPIDAPFSGERFEAYKEMAAQATMHGSLFIGQINHPGRQAKDRLQPNPISASDVQIEGEVMGMHFAKPHAASQAEIDRVIEGFAHTAEYLDKAGWDGAQLHAAHGYLLAQFLTPATNKRTDKYGGSLESRSRLLIEIGQAIRKRTSKNFILGIKLNSVEFQDGGFSPEEAKELCQALEKNSFDFVELSGGTYEHLAFYHRRESTKKRESFFLEFADMITPSLTKTRSYVAGGLRTVPGMIDALKSVDGISLGRPVSQEPDLPKKILSGGVTGAVLPEIDSQNFGLTNVASGTQIRQVGNDNQPLDLSKKEDVEAFMKDMGAWADKMAKDSEMLNYGYVDISSVKAIPYGETSV